jgi:hypothetical protein
MLQIVLARLCAVEARVTALESSRAPDPTFVTMGSALVSALRKLDAAIAGEQR